MWGKVTPVADTTEPWIAKEQLRFQLSNEAFGEQSWGDGRIKRVSMN